MVILFISRAVNIINTHTLDRRIDMRTSSHRLPKLSTIMPDLMESSETEDNDDDTPSENEQTTQEQIFPSLPDNVLKKIGCHKDRSISNEKLTENEIENKFTILSLAFKTDKFTLPTRLELLQRHRNTTEENIDSELKALKNAIHMLNRFIPDPKIVDLFTNIQQHVEVIQQSINRLSGKAEMYGAIQQEERLSAAADIMVAHVENLKRIREREHNELEETRRLLLETRLLSRDKRDEIALSQSPLLDSCGPSRSPMVSRRRASVAGYQRPMLSDFKAGGNNFLLYSKPIEVKRSLVGSFSIVAPNSNSSAESSPPIMTTKPTFLDSSSSPITEETTNKEENGESSEKE